MHILCGKLLFLTEGPYLIATQSSACRTPQTGEHQCPYEPVGTGSGGSSDGAVGMAVGSTGVGVDGTTGTCKSKVNGPTTSRSGGVG